MKKTILFAITLFSVFAFSACGGAVEEQSTNDKVTESEVSDNAEVHPPNNEVENDEGSESTSDLVQPELQANSSGTDQAEDVRIFNEAVAGLDKGQCNDITGESLKKNCLSTVGNKSILGQALSNGDSNLCNAIVDEEVKGSCINKVEFAQNQASTVEEDNFLNEVDKKSDDISNQALNDGNPESCNSIEDPIQKESCFYKVYANQAIQQSDPSLCDNLNNQSDLQACKDFVESSLE